MRLFFSAVVAVASLTLPAVAHAATMDDFTVTGQGLDLTFSLPSSPAVGNNYSQGLFFYVGDVSFTENGSKMTASDVYFFTKADQGGFMLADAAGFAIDNLDFTGPVLFTGGVKNPTFKEGTFTLTADSCGISLEAADVNAGGGNCKYNLSIDPSSPVVTTTPEPASLALLGTGALGAIGVVRRRLSA